jgi:hypothetical protein
MKIAKKVWEMTKLQKRLLHINVSTLYSTDTDTEYSKHPKHACVLSCPCIFQRYRFQEHRPPKYCFIWAFNLIYAKTANWNALNSYEQQVIVRAISDRFRHHRLKP